MPETSASQHTDAAFRGIRTGLRYGRRKVASGGRDMGKIAAIVVLALVYMPLLAWVESLVSRRYPKDGLAGRSRRTLTKRIGFLLFFALAIAIAYFMDDAELAAGPYRHRR
jgi:hypothetical protein